MKKPSSIKVIKATCPKIWLLPGFRAITFFGRIYTKTKADMCSINLNDNIDSNFKCHETIHVRQAEDTHDSWFLFYILYIWQWICNLPLITIHKRAPYRLISFEMEAFFKENDWKYPMNGKVSLWRKFNALKLKEKRKIAKRYYEGNLPYWYVLNEYFKNNGEPV